MVAETETIFTVVFINSNELLSFATVAEIFKSQSCKKLKVIQLSSV